MKIGKNIIKNGAKISIIILIITFFSSCFKQPDNIVLKSANISVDNNNAKMILFVEVNNPNFYTITLKNIDADVFLNDTKIGTITDNSEHKIPANGSSIIELPIEFELTDVLNNLGNILGSLFGQKIKASVDGILTFKAMFVEKQIKIQRQTEVEL